MTKSSGTPYEELYDRVEEAELRRLMDEAINKDKSADDVRRDFLFARVPGSDSYNKEIADDFKKKIKEAQAKEAQGLEAKKEQAPDNDVFGNLWGGVSGLAGAAGDALDAERKRVENAIKKHTQTEAKQQQVTKTAAERTRLLGDAVARELREKRENQELERQPLLPLSRASSESDASSTSGSSRSNQSTTTRGTVKSGVSALEALTDQKRKTQGPQNGPQNGPFASPPSASVSKGSESEGDKKNQFAYWGDVKNGFLKFRTCLYNAGTFAFSSVKNFFNANVVEPISKFLKERDASEQKELDEFFEEIQRERAASDKAFNEALRKSLSAPFLAVSGALNETLEKERNFGVYKATNDNQGGGWRFKRTEVRLGNLSNLAGTASQVPGQAATMGVKGAGLVGKGLGVLGGGAVSVAGTTFGVAKFMATPGDSSSGRTWKERLQGAGSLTQGMSSGYGPTRAGKDFARWVAADNSSVQTTGLPSGRGVAKFFARGTVKAASAGASMASRVANAEIFYFPGR